MNEDLKKLYDAVSSKFEIGSFDSFQSKMQTTESRKGFYDAVSAKGYDLGDYDSYESRLSKKKDSADSSLAQPSSASATTEESGQFKGPYALEDNDQLKQNVEQKLKQDQQGFGPLANPSIKAVLNNIGNTFETIALNTNQAINHLASRATEFVTGSPDPASYITNLKVAEKIKEEKEQSFENTVVRRWDADKSYEENIKDAQAGVVQTFKEQGAIKGTANLVALAVESSPYAITAIGTSGAGGLGLTAGLFTTQGYGGSIAEEYMKDGDISMKDETKAAIKGAIEGVTSVVFNGFEKVGQQVFKGVAKEEIKQVAKQVAKGRMKSMLESVGYTAGMEGMEELVQEVSSYAIDQAYDGKKINWSTAMEIGLDSFILGSVSAAPFGAAAGQYKYTKAKSIVDETYGSVSSEEGTQSTKDNPAKKEYLKNKRRETVNNFYVPEEVDEQDAAELEKRYFAVKEKSSILPTIQDPKLRESLEAEIKAEKDAIKEIIGKYEEQSQSVDESQDMIDDEIEKEAIEDKIERIKQDEQKGDRSAETTEGAAVGADTESQLQSAVPETGATNTVSAEQRGESKVRSQEEIKAAVEDTVGKRKESKLIDDLFTKAGGTDQDLASEKGKLLTKDGKPLKSEGGKSLIGKEKLLTKKIEFISKKASEQGASPELQKAIDDYLAPPPTRESLDVKMRENISKISQRNKKQGITRKIEGAAFKNEATKAGGSVAGKLMKGLDTYGDKVVSPILKKTLGFISDQTVGRVKKAKQRSVERVIQQKVAERLDNREQAVSKIEQSMASISTMAERAVYSMFPQLVEPKAEAKTKRQLKGEKNLAKNWGARLNDGLKEHPAYNFESLSKVHALMDKEAAKNVVGISEEELADIDSLTYEGLNSDEKQMYDYLRSINDYIHNLNYSMGLIDKETYEKNKGTYIARMYEEIELNDMKSLVEQKVLDSSIYQARKELYEKAQSVKDPVYLTMKRFYQTMNNAAVLDYTRRIVEFEGAALDAQSYEALPDYEKKNYVKIQSYGKLNSLGEIDGMFVKKNLAEDIMGKQFFDHAIGNLAMPLLDMYDKSWFRQMTKQGLTVLNPMTRAVNITTGFIFGYLGGADPISFARNRVIAKEELDNFSEDVEFLFLEGALSMNHIQQEFGFSKGISGQEAFGVDADLGISIAGDKGNVLQQISRSDFLKRARESYGQADDIAKIALFKSLLEQGFSRQEAVEKVRNHMQDYSSVGKMFSLGAKVPIFGNTFGRFQADMLRIAGNSIMDKPVTTATYLGALYGMYALTQYLNGEDEDREKVRTERDFVPSMFGIPLIWKVGDTEVNVAKFMSPMYTYSMENDEDNMMRKVMPINLWWKDGKMDFNSSDPTIGALWDAYVSGVDFGGRNIANPSNNPIWDDTQTAQANKAIYALRGTIGNIIPIKLAHDMLSSYFTGMDYYNRNRDISKVLISRIVKMETFSDKEYQKAAIRKINKIDDQIDEIKYGMEDLKKGVKREIVSIKLKELDEDKQEAAIKRAIDQMLKRVEDYREEMAKLQTEKLNMEDLSSYITVAKESDE